jgi:hypothetical protein
MILLDESTREERLARDEEKWNPVFRRNRVYADCGDLSAIAFTQIAVTYLRSRLRRLR